MSARKPPPKASALFKPFELQQYKMWRLLYLDDITIKNEDVPLPTAFEYADYLDWRKSSQARRSPRNTISSDSADAKIHGDKKKPKTPAIAGSVLAQRCAHPLHPGHTDITTAQPDGDDEIGEVQGSVAWCPTCILKIHCTLMGELWNNWLAVGGPWRGVPAGVTAETFALAKQAYYYRKVDLVNTMDHVEDMAAAEVAWEHSHPNGNVDVAKKYGAVKAMEIYQNGLTFPAQLAEANQTPPRTTPAARRTKKLSYSPGTPENTRHRPNVFYARMSTAYDPDSPHACPDKEGWVDTALRFDWEFNVRQCRLLLCDKNPSLPDVKYRELTGERHKDNLMEGIDIWFSRMDPDWVQQWTNILTTTTDIFVAWKSDSYVGVEDGFNNWDKIATLVGSNLEAHALEIGDIDEEEIMYQRAHQSPEPQPQEEDNDEDEEDFFDQTSLASDDESKDEETESWADPTDIEDQVMS